MIVRTWNSSLTDTMLNKRQMTMVVARYNENMDWLKDLPWDYIVFNKGEDDLPSWIKNQVRLPNIGREAHTYLTYIIDNYDNLPDYTICVQGNPFEHTKKLTEKINNFDGSSDFFPLSDKTLPSDGSGGKHHPGLKVAESAGIFLNNMEFFESPMGAQFIVSKKAILFHSKMTYQKIVESMIKGQANPERFITAHGKWYGKNCHRRRKNCECLNIFSAWVLERLWKTIFDLKNKTIYDSP